MNTILEPYKRYSENFLFERSESGVLTVTLNRPERLNAFLYPMFDEIADLWWDVAKDDETKAVIITGAGRGFCAGNDLSQPDADHEQIIKLMENGRRRTNGILSLDKPVIAAINGPAVGIGLALALMCDITIAADDAILIEGHTKVGVAAGDHAVLIWPLLMSMAKAKYYALTSERITGEEAERIGMVTMSLPKEEVRPKAQAVAEQLVQGSASAISWTKRALNHWIQNNTAQHELSTALEMLGFFEEDIIKARDEFRTSPIEDLGRST